MYVFIDSIKASNQGRPGVFDFPRSNCGVHGHIYVGKYNTVPVHRLIVCTHGDVTAYNHVEYNRDGLRACVASSDITLFRCTCISVSGTAGNSFQRNSRGKCRCIAL